MSNLEQRYKKAAQLSNTVNIKRSEEALRDIIRDHPDFLPARATLIAVLEKLGRIDEVEEMIASVPDHEIKDHHMVLAIANYHLRQKNYEQALSTLDFYDPSQSEEAKKKSERCYFMQSKCHDALGHYDTAFKLAEKANENVRNIYNIKNADLQRTTQEIGQHKQTISKPGWLESWTEPVKYSGVPPVFIMGFPRSGTTLLDVMLNTLPRIKAMDERPTVDHLVSGVMGRAVGNVGNIAKLDKNNIKQLQKEYFDYAANYVELKGKQILVDKMPLSERYIHILYRIFPNAKFIYMLRHPCDVTLSCYMQNFVLNPITVATIDLEATARQYAAAVDLFNTVRERLPADIHIVKYESLVGRPEKTSRALLDFLGLPWRKEVLDFHNAGHNDSDVVSASYQQVTEPLYQKSAGRWKHYETYLQDILPILEPASVKFGYEL